MSCSTVCFNIYYRSTMVVQLFVLLFANFFVNNKTTGEPMHTVTKESNGAVQPRGLKSEVFIVSYVQPDT